MALQVCSGKFMISVLVALIIFGNHYARDCVGALEKQLEAELGFTRHDYSILNALYFFPNMITPLVAGVFTERLGGVASCFFLSTLIVSIGHLLFGLGVQIEVKSIMFIGKAISGAMYEIIDALMPITYLSPIYKKDFPLVVGLLQIFLRSGSIVNFILSPVIYKQYGVKAALWLSVLIGCTALPLFLGARVLQMRVERESNPPSLEKSDDTSNSTPTPPQSSDSSSQSNQHEQATLSLCPPGGYPLSYYLYLFSGTFLYGGIVPLWFFGSKYLQDKFHLSVSTGDSLLTVPEGAVVVVGLPLGAALSYFSWSTSTKLFIMMTAMFIMAGAYFALFLMAQHYEYLPHPSSSPVPLLLLIVIIVGAGFSFACNLFWGLIAFISPPGYLSPSAGLLSCAVNVLPSLLPPLIAAGGEVSLVLMAMSLLGGGCAGMAALLTIGEERREVEGNVKKPLRGEGEEVGETDGDEGEESLSMGDRKSKGKDRKGKTGKAEYEMVPITDLDEEQI